MASAKFSAAGKLPKSRPDWPWFSLDIERPSQEGLFLCRLFSSLTNVQDCFHDNRRDGTEQQTPWAQENGKDDGRQQGVDRFDANAFPVDQRIKHLSRDENHGIQDQQI